MVADTGQSKTTSLEAVIRAVTVPINGQYPRPWMSNLTEPASARVFTVGKNQKKRFAIDLVGPHEHYLDALFNRGSESCRALYDRVTDTQSPTRRNTDDLVRRLATHGVTDVLETNVICYSTPMSADLRQQAHTGGAARGREIFKALLEVIKPEVLIAHGTGTVRELERVLGDKLPSPPSAPTDPISKMVNGTSVFVIPSLAPPGFNKWARWAPEHLDLVSRKVAALLDPSV